MREYILKLQLVDSDIWRELSVSGETTFYNLHKIIQIAFGWNDKHLHRFMVDGLEIGDYEDEDKMPINFKYEKDADLHTIFKDKMQVLYEYDYGDGWEIEIKVLKRKIIEKQVKPCILACNGGMVKDDCGGVEGLKQLAEIPVNIEELNIVLAHTYE